MLGEYDRRWWILKDLVGDVFLKMKNEWECAKSGNDWGLPYFETELSKQQLKDIPDQYQEWMNSRFSVRHQIPVESIPEIYSRILFGRNLFRKVKFHKYRCFHEARSVEEFSRQILARMDAVKDSTRMPRREIKQDFEWILSMFRIVRVMDGHDVMGYFTSWLVLCTDKLPAMDECCCAIKWFRLGLEQIACSPSCEGALEVIRSLKIFGGLLLKRYVQQIVIKSDDCLAFGISQSRRHWHKVHWLSESAWVEVRDNRLDNLVIRFRDGGQLIRYLKTLEWVKHSVFHNSSDLMKIVDRLAEIEEEQDQLRYLDLMESYEPQKDCLNNLIEAIGEATYFLSCGNNRREFERRQAFLREKFYLVRRYCAVYLEHNPDDDFWDGEYVFELAYYWTRHTGASCQEIVEKYLKLALHWCEKKSRGVATWVDDFEFPVQFCGGNLTRLSQVVTVRDRRLDISKLKSVWKLMQSYQNITRLLLGISDKKLIGRSLSALIAMQRAFHFDHTAMHRQLTQLDRIPGIAEGQGSFSKTSSSPTLCKIEQDLALIRDLNKMAGNGGELPKAFRRILERRKILEKEYQVLSEKAQAAKRPSDNLVERLENLRRYLADETTMNHWIRRDLQGIIPKYRGLGLIEVLEYVSVKILNNHFSSRFPGLEKCLEEPDVENAFTMLQGLSDNKRLLKKVIKNHVLSALDEYILNHPENRRFLKSMASKGLNIQAWLQPWKIKIRGYDSIHTVYVEQDKLKVLQMGNLFDTCLSADDFNAFSTVCNAVEINKKVIYVKDESGSVVGRKLIVLAPSGSLLGFHNYGEGEFVECEDPELPEKTRQSLWIGLIMDLLSKQIAASTGAALAGEKEINNLGNNSKTELCLFSQWYDDGAVPFDPWLAGFRGDAFNPSPSSLALLPEMTGPWWQEHRKKYFWRRYQLWRGAEIHLEYND